MGPLQMHGTVHELGIDLALTDGERDSLRDALLALRSNPYSAYHAFAAEVRALVADGHVPPRLVELCRGHQEREPVDNPFLSLANCPLDPVLPVWNHADPVNDKRRRKATFVAEGFLEVFAALTDQPVLAYANVNNGDRFQDIYPMESMHTTQSQKALGPLWFHKDLANHFVRPDYVNMLGIRADAANHVYTTFAGNMSALVRLDASTKAALRRTEFYTPFDDLTVMGGQVELGRAADHQVLSGECDLRYFENRTVGTTERARTALEALTRSLHEGKRRVHMMPGDFVSLYNNYCVHAKEIHAVGDPEALRERWIMKTVNVADLSVHKRHFCPEDYGVVNG